MKTKYQPRNQDDTISGYVVIHRFSDGGVIHVGPFGNKEDAREAVKCRASLYPDSLGCEIVHLHYPCKVGVGRKTLTF